jgi:DNA-binding NtrC family response regulator
LPQKFATLAAMAFRLRTIVIADDDRLILSSLEHALALKGHRVLLAEHGGAAIAHLERQSVDVVFLDVLMPRKEGIETLIEIKRRFPAVRVHVMSGGGTIPMQDFLQFATHLGADGILKKPISHKDILAIIDALPVGDQ